MASGAVIAPVSTKVHIVMENFKRSCDNLLFLSVASGKMGGLPIRESPSFRKGTSVRRIPQASTLAFGRIFLLRGERILQKVRLPDSPGGPAGCCMNSDSRKGSL